MHHAEFADKWRSGQVRLTVHKTLARRAGQSGLLPPAYQKSQSLYLISAFVGLFATGFSVLITFWLGLLGMLILIVLLHVIRRRAEKILETALTEDERLYNFAQFNQLISIHNDS